MRTTNRKRRSGCLIYIIIAGRGQGRKSGGRAGRSGRVRCGSRWGRRGGRGVGEPAGARGSRGGRCRRGPAGGVAGGAAARGVCDVPAGSGAASWSSRSPRGRCQLWLCPSGLCPRGAGEAPRTHGPQRQAAARRDAVSVPPASPCPLCPLRKAAGVALQTGGAVRGLETPPRAALPSPPLARLLRYSRSHPAGLISAAELA